MTFTLRDIKTLAIKTIFPGAKAASLMLLSVALLCLSSLTYSQVTGWQSYGNCGIFYDLSGSGHVSNRCIEETNWKYRYGPLVSSTTSGTSSRTEVYKYWLWYGPDNPCGSGTWSNAKQACTGGGSANNCGSGTCSNPAAGNPILISTGNKYQSETDYSGGGPFPLVIHRAYNSVHGAWQFNGRDTLEVNGDKATWRRADGKYITFGLLDGEWEAPFGALLTLSGTTLSDEDNTIYEFESNGKLASVTDLYGHSKTFDYDPSGNLISVTHSSGELLVYGYDGSGQITSITTSDDNVYQYSYTDGLLASVTYPGQTTSKNYHYENPGFPGALTGVSDERGIRYATWGYDAQGRAISSEHTDGADRVTFVFNGNNSTTVTNSLGKQTTYHFKQYNGVFKVVEVEGHQSTNCTAANQYYEYYDHVMPGSNDIYGLLKSKTDWQGNLTEFGYNERGLEIVRTEAKGTTVERVITTQWHTQFNLPVTIIEPAREISFEYDTNGRLLSRTVNPITSP